MKYNNIIKFIIVTIIFFCFNDINASTKHLIGDLYYWVDYNSKTASVASGGFGYYKGDIVVPDTITYDGNTYYVISLGMSAFHDCSELTSIKLGKYITAFGDQTFNGCSALKELVIPAAVNSMGRYVFHNCYGLEKIVVEEGNSKYDSRDNCNAIIQSDINSIILGCKNTIIPTSVIGIGEEAFINCIELKSISIPPSISVIGHSAFSGCFGLNEITLSPNLKTINGGAFYNCTGIKNVHISDLDAWFDIEFYEESSNPLFYAENLYLNDELVTDIVIPNNIKDVPAFVFTQYKKLKSVTFHDSILSIGAHAFHNCSGLTDLFIPKSVTQLGGFIGCSNLESIVVDDENPVYDSRNNCNAIIKSEDNELLYGCANTIIPNDIISISSEAFFNCNNLKSIVIPDSLFYIYNYAFSYSGLTEITIPKGTRLIEGGFINCNELTTVYYNTVNAYSPYHSHGHAFDFCPNLKKIVFGENVNIIPGVLIGYTDLDIVISLNTTPPSCNEMFFSTYTLENATLIVPKGTLQSYASANKWKDFINIQEADVDGIENIDTDNIKTEIERYDIFGRKLIMPTKGINIIKYNDDTSTKVFVK